MNILKTMPFILIFTFSSETYALKKGDIIWFKPLRLSIPGTNLTEIVLFGKTTPSTTVTIDRNSIIFADEIATKNYQENKSKVDSSSLSTTSNKSGYFQLMLKLPVGFTQATLVSSSFEKKLKTFTLSFLITRKKVTFNAPVKKSPKPVRRQKARIVKWFKKKYGLIESLNKSMQGWWFEFGSGVNFQSYSQSLDDSADIKFQNIKLPSIEFSTEYLKDLNSYSLSFYSIPGEIKSVTEPFTLEDGNYSWRTLNIEYGRDLKKSLFGDRSRSVFRAGFNYHIIPFFVVDFDDTAVADDHKLITASVGFSSDIQITKNNFFEILFRYQYPFAASAAGNNDFSIKPKFIIDGSLGIKYRLANRHYLGLSWFGQWHKFTFDFTNGGTGSQFSGDQNLFYTTGSIRYYFHLK